MFDLSTQDSFSLIPILLDTQMLGPHNDSHQDSSGSEPGLGNLNSQQRRRIRVFGREMTISDLESDASPGPALRDGICILCFLRNLTFGF